MAQAVMLCGCCPSSAALQQHLASNRFLPLSPPLSSFNSTRSRSRASVGSSSSSSSRSSSSSNNSCSNSRSSSWVSWQLKTGPRHFLQASQGDLFRPSSNLRLIFPAPCCLPRAKRTEINATGGEEGAPSFDSVKKEVTKAAKKVKDKQRSTSGGDKLRIGAYFVTWWGLNIVFNVYNKKVLNVYPFPWLTSVLSLLAGTVIMLASWCTGCVPPPQTDLDFWKSLLPVAIAHSVGHVAATISMARSAVAFTQIIKSAEPAFSVLLSRFFLSENYSMPVYLSLLLVVGGCCLSALTDLNFDTIGFLGANVSNVAFVFRNYFSKRGMSKRVSGLNYYGCLCIMSLAILTPFALAFEGFRAWSLGWRTATRAIGRPFFWWVLSQSVFYHLYNQVSYMSLDQISPLTFSIGNTMKRVSVIAASLFIFKTPVKPINLIGAAIAILGTFLYAQVAALSLLVAQPLTFAMELQASK